MSSPARSTPDSLPTLVEELMGRETIIQTVDNDKRLLSQDVIEVSSSASEVRNVTPQRPLRSRTPNGTPGGRVAKARQPKPVPSRRPPVRKQTYEFIRGPANIAAAFSVAQAEYRDKVMYCWFIKMGRKRGELPTDEDKERIKKDPHVIAAGEKLNMADKAFTENGEYVTSMTVTCDSYWSVEQKLGKKKAELDHKYRAEQIRLQKAAVGTPRALRSGSSNATSMPLVEYGSVPSGSSC